MNEIVKTDLGNKEVFSRNLLRFIKMSGKTQIEVAERVGVSQGTISDWVNGRSYPRMDKVQLLAELFGVQKSELVEDVCIAKDTVSEKQQKLLDKFNEVPEKYQDGLLDLIEVYVKNLR